MRPVAATDVFNVIVSAPATCGRTSLRIRNEARSHDAGAQHLGEPMRFKGGVHALLRDEAEVFAETCITHAER